MPIVYWTTNARRSPKTWYMPFSQPHRRKLDRGATAATDAEKSQGMLDHGRLGGTGYVSISQLTRNEPRQCIFCSKPGWFDRRILNWGEDVTLFAQLSSNWLHQPWVCTTGSLMVKLNHNDFWVTRIKFDQVNVRTGKNCLEYGRHYRRHCLHWGSTERQLQKLPLLLKWHTNLHGYRSLVYVRNGGFKMDALITVRLPISQARPNNLGVCDPCWYHQAEISYEQWWLQCYQAW